MILIQWLVLVLCGLCTLPAWGASPDDAAPREIRDANDAVFTGELVAGRLEGYGTMRDAAGNTFEGDFLAGQFSYGEYCYAVRRERYLGPFVAGQPQGAGTLFLKAHGLVFSGDFQHGQPTQGWLRVTEGKAGPPLAVQLLGADDLRRQAALYRARLDAQAGSSALFASWLGGLDSATQVACPGCQGTGWINGSSVEGTPCRRCDGAGHVTRPAADLTDNKQKPPAPQRNWGIDATPEPEPEMRPEPKRSRVEAPTKPQAPCKQCFGTGRVLRRCDSCGGSGVRVTYTYSQRYDPGSHQQRSVYDGTGRLIGQQSGYTGSGTRNERTAHESACTHCYQSSGVIIGDAPCPSCKP